MFFFRLGLCLWILVFVGTARADQKALYAISSLQSHLAIVIEEEESKIFSENDVLKLWEAAGGSPEILMAQSLYFDCKKDEFSERKKALLEIDGFLTKAWENLNPYYEASFEQEYPVGLFSKGLGHRRFLLSEEDGLYKVLLNLFSIPRALESPEVFEQIGFFTVSKRASGMRVASHDQLPGHLIKIYLEEEKPKPNWEWAVRRCIGVTNIKKLIKEKELKHFVVPEKRIFTFPTEREFGKELMQETSPIVLLVTDMKILDREECLLAWAEATKEQIDELYCLLSHGYSSCLLPANIPKTRKGKFACIDTEVPHRKQPLHHVNRFLSEKMSGYWDELIRTGGQPSFSP